MDKLKSVSASDFKYIYVILGVFAELSLILLVTYFPSYAIAQGASEPFLCNCSRCFRVDVFVVIDRLNATGILGRWIPDLCRHLW